jgi:hypothetical protein
VRGVCVVGADFRGWWTNPSLFFLSRSLFSLPASLDAMQAARHQSAYRHDTVAAGGADGAHLIVSRIA